MQSRGDQSQGAFVIFIPNKQDHVIPLQQTASREWTHKNGHP